MPKINIDELVEPIEITVGGKDYIVLDISRETAKEMAKVGGEADELEIAILDLNDLIEAARKASNLKRVAELRGKVTVLMEKTKNIGSAEKFATIMTKVLGADEKDIAKLGLRKLLTLMKRIMELVNEEVVGKNAPEVAAVK